MVFHLMKNQEARFNTEIRKKNLHLKSFNKFNAKMV